MKQLASLLLFFITGVVICQPTWQPLTSIPESVARYDDIFFLNEDLGWAADGAGSAVYKTSDGGTSWTLQLSIGGVYLRNIEFLNQDIGFLGTLANQFYKTIDGGNNWQLVTTIPGPVQAICGLDIVGTTVYGCGAYFSPAYIIKSIDSGSTWQFIDMSQYAESLVEVLFIDENLGFASGGDENGGVILKTVNGGLSWSQIYNSGIPGEYVWKMQKLFSNPDIMFASVESVEPLNGKLLKSTDGGNVWISKAVPDTHVQAVGFISENHGWMGGHGLGFLETFDSGNTWTDIGLGSTLNRIQIFNEDLAYCSGKQIYKFFDNNLIVDSFPTIPAGTISITISPNPIQEILTFKINYAMEDHMIIRLFDINGKLLQTFTRETISSPGTKNYSFPFVYPEGIYYLNFHNDAVGHSEKIVKIR